MNDQYLPDDFFHSCWSISLFFFLWITKSKCFTFTFWIIKITLSKYYLPCLRKRITWYKGIMFKCFSCKLYPLGPAFSNACVTLVSNFASHFVVLLSKVWFWLSPLSDGFYWALLCWLYKFNNDQQKWVLTTFFDIQDGI